jgi:type II secretory pathway pseudopilin PulG
MQVQSHIGTTARRHVGAGASGSRTRRGFTFIEVLFATILLGIGFIMIAAVFPVAIQQTSVVSNETQANAVEQDAIKKIQSVADSINASATMFPATGTSAAPAVWAITTSYPTPGYTPNGTGGDNLFPATPAAVKGPLGAIGADGFFSADRRYGWVGFYRRDSATSPSAQVFVIALQNPNFENYLYPPPSAGQTTVSSPVPPPVPPNIYGYSPPNAAQIPAMFYYNADGTTTIQLGYNPNATSPQSTFPNFNTGAYVLIGSTAPPAAAGSPFTTANTATPAGLVGRFFRLGTSTPSPASAGGPGTYQTLSFIAQPGSDITTSDAVSYSFTAGTTTFAASVWVIGTAPDADANGTYTGNPTGSWNGSNQDIGIATGFIRINTTNN